MEEILFTKMHGLGNDYIYIYCPTDAPSEIEELSRQMSRPHFAVGSDGIILILPSERADFKMRIFNADGSEARMCGNGIRCVGKYVFDHGLTTKKSLDIDTQSGIKHLRLHTGPDGMVDTVTVDMGRALTADVVLPKTPTINAPVVTSAGTVRITAISMGNPHGVIFVDSIDDTDVHNLGREIELNPMWPERANIEFAQVTSPHSIKLRVWERGSGETMACGTGACATAAAAILTGRCTSPVTVSLPGGDLEIEVTDAADVTMTGPAATVFEGRYFRHEPPTR